jgi:hypothetical protein
MGSLRAEGSQGLAARGGHGVEGLLFGERGSEGTEGREQRALRPRLEGLSGVEVSGRWRGREHGTHGCGEGEGAPRTWVGSSD